MVVQPGDARAAGRVPLMTRLVKVLGEAELKLDAAARAGDSVVLESMLAEDFELRRSGRPDVPVPREDWLAASRISAAAEATFDSMAVREIGDLAIASFLLRRAGEGAESGARFVVDVWRDQGNGHWVLLVRYESGAKDQSPESTDARPDGRQ